MTQSWDIVAGAPASPPTLAGPDKIALMRQISITPTKEIATWMIWMRMSGWWKSCFFPPLPPPKSPLGLLTKESMAALETWRVPRCLLHQRSTPTVISPPRILSTSRNCSSCNSNKHRTLLRPLPRSLVNLASQPSNRHSLKRPNIIITPTSSLAPMMSTSTLVDTSDRL